MHNREILYIRNITECKVQKKRYRYISVSTKKNLEIRLHHLATIIFFFFKSTNNWKVSSLFLKPESIFNSFSQVNSFVPECEILQIICYQEISVIDENKHRNSSKIDENSRLVSYYSNRNLLNRSNLTNPNEAYAVSLMLLPIKRTVAEIFR